MLELVKWMWGKGIGVRSWGDQNAVSCGSSEHPAPLPSRVWHSYHCTHLISTFLQDEIWGVGARRIMLGERMKRRVCINSRFPLRSASNLILGLRARHSLAGACPSCPTLSPCARAWWSPRTVPSSGPSPGGTRRENLIPMGHSSKDQL